MIHLDTNYLVASIVPATVQANQINAWLSAGEIVGICAMAWSEFLCGPASAAQVSAARATVSSIEVVNAADAEKAAELFNLTGRRRGSLADCLIAAVALRCGASLATENRADFVRIPSLTLVP